MKNRKRRMFISIQLFFPRNSKQCDTFPDIQYTLSTDCYMYLHVQYKKHRINLFCKCSFIKYQKKMIKKSERKWYFTVCGQSRKSNRDLGKSQKLNNKI